MSPNQTKTEIKHIPSASVVKTVDDDFVEPLLRENPNRFVLFPIHHPDIWKMYKLSQSSLWVAEEVDLTTDIRHWYDKLNDNERYFIEHVLAFFACSDGIVNENLAMNFANEIQIIEAKAFYSNQMYIENIHIEVYADLIKTLIKDDDRRTELFNAMYDIPCIKRKADWCFEYADRDNASFATRLLAFAIVEGVFFSGSFCSIFWLKKRGLMPGLCFSNTLISRDEALHTNFAVLLYSKLERKLSEKDAHDIMKRAVDIEIEFITNAIPVDLIGMNANLMIKYIKYVADVLIVQLGYNRIYNSENPFEFMDNIAIDGVSNFFERRVPEYNKASVSTDGKKYEKKFSIDEDF